MDNLDYLNTCLLCGGTPAECFVSLPPGDRLPSKANGRAIPWTLCADCRHLPDACERVDQALRDKG